MRHTCLARIKVGFALLSWALSWAFFRHPGSGRPVSMERDTSPPRSRLLELQREGELDGELPCSAASGSFSGRQRSGGSFGGQSLQGLVPSAVEQGRATDSPRGRAVSGQGQLPAARSKSPSTKQGAHRRRR